MSNATPTDLSQKRWEIIKDLLPEPAPVGRPCSINMRKLLNAILYVIRGGIVWHLLPLDLPPWQTVYVYFRHWTENGTLTWIYLHSHPQLYQ